MSSRTDDILSQSRESNWTANIGSWPQFSPKTVFQLHCFESLQFFFLTKVRWSSLDTFALGVVPSCYNEVYLSFGAHADQNTVFQKVGEFGLSKTRHLWFKTTGNSRQLLLFWKNTSGDQQRAGALRVCDCFQKWHRLTGRFARNRNAISAVNKHSSSLGTGKYQRQWYRFAIKHGKNIKYNHLCNIHVSDG